MSNDTEAYIDNTTGKFKKGNPGGGRPKGTPNKKTRKVEKLLSYLAEEGSDRFYRILEEQDDETYLDYYIKLLEYVIPRKQRVEAKVESTHTNIQITAPQPKRFLENKAPLKIEEAEVIPDQGDSKQEKKDSDSD